MKRIGFFAALILLLLSASVAMASSYDRIIGRGETVDGDVTVVDDALIVEEGGTIDGAVTIFGGSADIEGQVTGDVTVFGGEMSLVGSIDGDLVIFGGILEVSPDATVGGSCVTLGGTLEDDSDAVSCTTFGNRLGAFGVYQFPPIPNMPDMPEPPEVPDAPAPPPIEVRPPSLAARISGVLLDVSEVVGRSLFLGILALVVTAIFPRQLQQVSHAVRQKPAASGAVGLLTAIAGPSIIVLLLVVLAITCVGLLLYPAVFLLALALFAALLMGWIALGDLLGRGILRRLNIGTNLPLSAALGTTLLTLLLGGLGLLPFVWGEELVVILLASVGLGAVTLTQFGVKAYPPDAAPPVNPDKEDAVLKNMPAE